MWCAMICVLVLEVRQSMSIPLDRPNAYNTKTTNDSHLSKNINYTDTEPPTIIHADGQNASFGANVDYSSWEDMSDYVQQPVLDSINLWPRAIIPYRIDKTINTRIYEQWIIDSFKVWERHTCIRFVPHSRRVKRILHHDDYVTFYEDKQRCEAYVGRQIGPQKNLANIYCSEADENTQRKENHVLHEIGHVIGFVHEQSRPDRDNSVKILWENIQIQKEKRKQFTKLVGMNTYGLPYDIGSVMHYSAMYFSKNGRPTIQTVDPKLNSWMGNRNHLSFLDVKRANLAYGCNQHCDTRPNCQNDGYVGPNCACICPDGLTGPTCEDVVISPKSGCGGFYGGQYGYISSSRYPRDYLVDEDCFWLIKGPEGSTIHLKFLEFDTEFDVGCNECDFLEVKIYGIQQVGQRYCGNETGRNLTHNSNTLLLHFKSDKGFPGKGFRIFYSIGK